MQGSNLPQPANSMVGKLLVASTMMEDPVLSRSVCLVVHQDTENIFAVLLNRPMTPPPGMAKMMLEGSDQTSKDSLRPKARFKFPLAADETNADEEPSTNHEAANHEAANHEGGESQFSDEALSDDLMSDSPLPPKEKAKEIVAQEIAAQAAKALGEIHFGGPLAGPVVAVHDSSEHAEAETGTGVYVAAQRELLETLIENRPGSMRLIVGHLGWSADQLAAEQQRGFWHVIDATQEDVFTDDKELWPSVIRRATSNSLSRWIGIPDQPFSAEVN